MGTPPSGRAFIPAPPAALARRCVVLLLAAASACTDSTDPNFDPTEITVRVRITGNGGGRVTAPDPVGISCAKDHTRSSGLGDCSTKFVDAGAGGTFSLDAVADSNSTLVGWSGDCAGAACILSFRGYRDTTFEVTARFNLLPPQAVIEQPVDGASFFADDTVRASGHGIDRAGRRLLGELWTSSIDGTLCDDPDGCTGFRRVLSTGTHVITLRVKDSAGTPATTSVTIFVSDEEFNNPPVAELNTPQDGAMYDADALVRLSGIGTDPEDGRLPEESTVWSSSRDGALGTGWNLDRMLSSGTHIISLIVTDSGGKSDTASVEITVRDPNPTASISGRVTGNGLGVGGATVRLTGPVTRTATSSSSGNYSFTQLPAGTYTIRVDTELNIDFPSNPRTVTLAQGQALTVDFAGTY